MPLPRAAPKQGQDERNAGSIREHLLSPTSRQRADRGQAAVWVKTRRTCMMPGQCSPRWAGTFHHEWIAPVFPPPHLPASKHPTRCLSPHFPVPASFQALLLLLSTPQSCSHRGPGAPTPVCSCCQLLPHPPAHCRLSAEATPGQGPPTPLAPPLTAHKLLLCWQTRSSQGRARCLAQPRALLLAEQSSCKAVLLHFFTVAFRGFFFFFPSLWEMKNWEASSI